MENYTDYKEDDRPKRGLWAPGGYTGKCKECESLFIGDKRAHHCADCAYDMPMAESMNDKTDTPETDTAKFTHQDACLECMRPERELVDAYFSRKLERERNEAIKAVKALLKDNNQFSMDRFEMEGVDPYGSDSESYDMANNLLK